MKAFPELTLRGKERRLRRLVWQALRQYPIRVVDLRLLGFFTNLLYQVRTADGQRLVLRVCAPGWRTDTDLFSEASWLQDLAQHPEIGAPRLCATNDGQWLARASLEGVEGERRCVLMNWVAGISLEKQLNADNLEKMGMLFASLHQKSLGFHPPPGFTTLRMSSPFGRGEQVILWDQAIRSSSAQRSDWEILDETRQRVERAFAGLYANPAGLRVIHNDLWHGNIKVRNGRLFPLDFEDTIWGYPVQDLAMALQDLMMDGPSEQFDTLQQALRKGYERLAPWPEQYENQIDLFRAGRMLWVANYVASYQAQYFGEHLERTARLLEPFLVTGRLRKMEH